MGDWIAGFGRGRQAARVAGVRGELDGVTAEFREFWTERRVGTLVTLRRDGSPHVVPVGVTLDLETGLARVICSRRSQKARNALATGVAVVSQVDRPMVHAGG